MFFDYSWLDSPLLAGQGVGAMQAGFFIGSRIEVCGVSLLYTMCQCYCSVFALTEFFFSIHKNIVTYEIIR